MPTTERIIDISDAPAALSVRYDQLNIGRNGGSVTVPLSDLAVLVVSHPQVSYTHAVITGICEAGGAFVLCNEKRLPTGMLLPIEGHFVQAERFAAQAQSSVPIRKHLWKQVVRAKIYEQGKLLKTIRGEDHGLFDLVMKVRSGDTGSIETQAARRYWPALFGKGFRRNQAYDDQNRLLNYGYAVLRAVVARAVCAVGLHPSLGIHHHNRYDAFCLADDLMEPFRPLVDGVVAGLVEQQGPDAPLDKDTKAAIIEAIAGRRFTVKEDERTLFDLMAHMTSSLAAVFMGERKDIILPEL